MFFFVIGHGHESDDQEPHLTSNPAQAYDYVMDIELLKN